MANLATTAEVAEKLGVSVPRIHKLISQDRVVGAYKIGMKRGTWIIPVNENGHPKILPAVNRPRAFDKIS
jgi:hypothetical protein